MFVNTADSSSVFIHVHIHLLIQKLTNATLHTHGPPLSRTTQVSRYQKGKTNLDFIGARDSEWLWHQLGHMQVCISRQTDNHASTPPVRFLQAGCPSCHPTNSVKALEVYAKCNSTLELKQNETVTGLKRKLM